MKRLLVLGILSLSLGVQAAENENRAEPIAPRAQTLIINKTAQLVIQGIDKTCVPLRIELLRADALAPGYGRWSRMPVKTETGDYRVELALGPEFWPYLYPSGSFRLSCPESSLKTKVNRKAWALTQAENLLNWETDFQTEEEKP
ncbi:hypothetical protein COW36_20595 [bacterium (Candidatus Blackallbacteria) CG17_big_fil_post_rev_8_21_14_2_50_48_46]|uniref:Uncharacterized protein n=1 Tax=bacterium (Candidatus Blackallbacteria) CG17_big_fil_post_rev_8_21_14_2_50_48_46 TaxID=2014261 RepID=A0A2M7FZU8_9BACT|nr:MAG: hypothetical protein COW64_22920 [bacterium (Candidatus Blackallbacteria) CG18_big_fil_WC_8_21_14_2_50_49_26]PIW14805.1 MAG: hypothetical protein COW36_20595 [bacterium (Candidatus Blackallbacteria) CG17_big_fil_post_rev_8_21_14_2_50_48_46]PIW50907.1 MAG: hypothetical protein COW20_01410 [bacterium (Candidatus Blackallbacteria) CG13_big_fil_rev_8_21_14_2_50_49_14]